MPCKRKKPANIWKLFLILVITSTLLSTILLNQAVADDCRQGNTTALCETATSRNSFASPKTFEVTPPSPSAHRQAKRKPIILLGIYSEVDTFSERQRRNLIRQTYLKFDKVHHTDTPDRVCSLHDFSKQKTRKEDCQLVYTFVFFGGNRNGTSIEYNATYPVTVDDSSLTMKYEQDGVYLNIPEPNPFENVWAWYRYANIVWTDVFDYIAYTDTQVALLPTLFWENELFSGNRRKQRIYGGLQVERSDCIKSKCPSLKGDYVMRRFVLLSTDLVQYIATRIHPSQFPKLMPKETPDVAIANMLHSHEQQQQPLVNITLKGLISKTSSKGGIVGDFLQVWDRYKDKLVDYEDDQEVALVESSSSAKRLGAVAAAPPRVLMGIFTMDSPLEKERRAEIRKTYLIYYGNSETPHRICSLQELVNNKAVKEEECQMAYAFVMGGNPTGPTELVNSNASHPMTVPHVEQSHQDETDIVHLNIRENMEEGKSQTWFKYATTVLHDHYFDYIGKMDSDTMLYPNLFLDQVFSTSFFPSFPNNMRTYGGDYRFTPSFIGSDRQQLGPVYMGGHLYVLSADLARYITSPHCNRTSLRVYAEDKSIGNFVHSHLLPIRRIRMNTNAFEHPVKRVDRLRTLWRKYLTQQKKLE